MSDKSDTPRTDALQEQLAAMDGPECLYTEEMADRMWLLMRDLEEKLTYLFANAVGDSMALGIMELQRRELANESDRADAMQEVNNQMAASCKDRLNRLKAELAAAKERAEKANAERDALRENAERYRWILRQAAITDFIFKFLKSKERHVSNAIDAERAK